MGEKVNFVVAFPIHGFASVDVEQVTVELTSRVLGEDPKSWVAIRARTSLDYHWPPTPGDLRKRLQKGDVVAVYPREPASSIGGAVVWSEGSVIATATASVPIAQAPPESHEALAIAALKACGERARLCAVGNELELSGELRGELIPLEVARLPGVELVSFFGSGGRIEISRTPRDGSTARTS